MLDRDGYPTGVPCWVDLVQPDYDAAVDFYGELLGWTFDVRTPEAAPMRYAYALLGGRTVAGVGTPTPGEQTVPGWTTYVAVESADQTVAAVEANGGRVVAPPADIPGAGRVALCADPEGAVFGVWQAAENKGAQAVNEAGSWVFSELHTGGLERAETFYGAVFAWEADPFDLGDGQKAAIWRLPGYGDFLAERDPEIRERQQAEGAVDGFADAVAFVEPLAAGELQTAARWTVTFAVADADAAVARATSLGATVLTPLFDTDYTRQAVVEDPQGAVITLSEYRPPTAG